MPFSVFFWVFVIPAKAQDVSRVVAFAKYKADTTIPCSDTGGYKYSHGRSGEIFFTPATDFFFNYPFVYVPAIDFETGYNGLVKCDSSWELSPTDTDISTQFFDERGNIIYSLCNKKKNGVWQKYLSYGYKYDINNNLQRQEDTNWQYFPIIGVGVNEYNYNENNQLIRSVTLENGGDTTWFTLDTLTYTYNSDGTLAVDSEVHLMANCTSCLHFNYERDCNVSDIKYVNGLPDSVICWESTNQLPTIEQFTRTYYLSPDNDSLGADLDDFGDLRVTTTYDINHNVTSQTEEILVNPDSFSWPAPYKKQWTYNSFNQVTCERDYSRDSSGNWVFSNMIRFYYEIYEPEAPFNPNFINVFPSPASDNITIKLEWGQIQVFSVGIFDAIGRLVAQWNEPAMLQYEQSFSTVNLSSGIYFVRATAGGQKLVRQFVVAH